MKRPLWHIPVLAFLAILPACAAKAPPPPPWELAAQRTIRLGNEAYHRGCYALALQHYQAALETYAATDHVAGTALGLNNLGNTYRMRHQYEDALVCYTESGTRASSVQDQEVQQQALANRVSLLLELDRVAEAKALMASLPDGGMDPAFIRSRATILHLDGQSGEARALLSEALAEAPSLRKSGLYFTLGEILLASPSPEEAREALTQALVLDKEAGASGLIAADLMALARCEAALGNNGKAADAARRAMEIWALIQDHPKLAAHEDLFVELAARASMDLTMTRHLIQLWQAGRAVAGPCD